MVSLELSRKFLAFWKKKSENIQNVARKSQYIVTGNKRKNFHLRTLTATIIIPSVLPRSYTDYSKKKLMLNDIPYFGRSRKMSYEKAK